jgi:spore maturation protein CgeB
MGALALLVAAIVWWRPFKAPEVSQQIKKIAVLTRPDFQGEYSFARRVEAASKNLGWQADVLDIDAFKRIRDPSYDLVINLVPGRYKFRKAKHYLALFHPSHHYFDPDGTLSKYYRDYDGYLLSYPPEEKDKNFGSKGKPHMDWYPTIQDCEYKEVDPTSLFYLACIWGNRFNDAKMQKFLHLLDEESFPRIYGKDSIQKHCPKTYCSPIPFDSHSVCEKEAECGVVLVLHSDDHNVCGLPSGRIFEAAAASCVIISDQNEFVKKWFGDAVLYIDTKESAETILAQVKDHMAWIQANKEEALEKSRRSYAIYRDHFVLEDQLLRLESFHQRLPNRGRSFFGG